MNLSTLLSRSAALLILLAFSLAAVADKPPLALKRVALDEFMQHYLAVSLPITLTVPKSYEPARIGAAATGQVYWMKPGDVRHADRSGDLPIDNGWMAGNVSDDVGYDADHDEFIGIEDEYSRKQAQQKFSSMTLKRVTAAGHPVLLLRGTSRIGGTPVFAAYIATKLDTKAVYIAYRPPNNDTAIGDYVWQELERGLSSL